MRLTGLRPTCQQGWLLEALETHFLTSSSSRGHPCSGLQPVSVFTPVTTLLQPPILSLSHPPASLTFFFHYRDRRQGCCSTELISSPFSFYLLIYLFSFETGFCYVVQAGPELGDPLASASRVLGPQVCHHHTRL